MTPDIRHIQFLDGLDQGNVYHVTPGRQEPDYLLRPGKHRFTQPKFGTSSGSFKTAYLSNAAAIILLHQHPTGDPSPSSEDISIARRLKEAGEIMGIRILDHIIIGDGEYLSFVERGLL